MKRKVSFELSDKISSKQKKRQRDLQHHTERTNTKKMKSSTKSDGMGKERDYSRSKTKHNLRQALESEDFIYDDLD